MARPRNPQTAAIATGKELVDISAADHVFNGRCIKLVVLTAGDIVCRMSGMAADVTISTAEVDKENGVLVGHFDIIRKAGTTATGIHAWYY